MPIRVPMPPPPPPSLVPARAPNKQYLLERPANPAFIAISLLVAFVLDLAPWGRLLAIPDFVALVLVFWNIHQPRRVGMGVAFLMGILVDVHDAARLGESALAYTLLSYGAIMLHRRVVGFPILLQSLQVLPLFLVAQLVVLVVRVVIGAPFPGWAFFLESVTTALLWPLATWLLLAPQRRPRERDETRPI
jgi:rod shape-determining protein MreD